MENVRPIDANAAKALIKDFAKAIACENGGVDNYTFVLKEAYDIVSEAQTLDYAPVRHAHWIENQDGGVCSDCWNGLKVYKKIRPMIVFCPFCGAKMDGGKNDES